MTTFPSSFLVREGNPDRADRVLARFLPGEPSRASIARLIRSGRVLVSGRPVRPSTILKPGDRVEIVARADHEIERLPQDAPQFEILFEDEDLIIVDKPPGLVVHPAAGRPSGTLVDALVQTYLEAQPQLVQPLYTALSEIAENVLEHSGRTHGYLALQRFPRSNDVALAVGDSGIGLRRRLASRFPIPDDRTAVVWAARMHVSSVDRPGRGRGIGRVVELTGRHRGQVILISGRASGTFEHGSPFPVLADLPVAHPGTLAHVRLSL